MRRSWGLLGCVGAACLAGTATAAPAGEHVFRVTLSATASAEWDHTAAPVVDGSCTRTHQSEALRKVVFRTRRPVVVRLVDGRLRAADLGPLGGSVSLRGAWTTQTQCDGAGEGSAVIRDCVPSRRAFSRGRVRLSSPASGRVAFGPARGIRLRRSACPPEPGPVTAAPLGIVPPISRLPLDKLTNSEVARVTLTFTFSRDRVFGDPQAGQLEQSAKWRLVFERVGS